MIKGLIFKDKQIFKVTYSLVLKELSDIAILVFELDICQYQPLFLLSVSVISERCNCIVICVLIMSFLVIMTSLISFMILIIIEKMLILIKRIRR